MRRLLVTCLALILLPASVSAGNVVANKAAVWPTRTVPLLICDRDAVQRLGKDVCAPQKARPGKKERSGRLAEPEAALIRQTVARWNRDYRGHVRLVPVSRPRGPSTIVFRAASEPDRCSTQKIGFDPEQRLKYVSLGRRCGKASSRTGTSRGTVAHEILHALGVYHEQQRTDRSKVLKVRAGGRKAHQWAKACGPQEESCSGEQVAAKKVGPYDLGSLMHYSLDPRRARLTAEGRERLREQRLRAKQVGQRKWLSRSDERALARLYPSVEARS